MEDAGNLKANSRVTFHYSFVMVDVGNLDANLWSYLKLPFTMAKLLSYFIDFL